MNVTEKRHIVFGLPSLLVGGIEKHLIQQLSHYNQEKYRFSVITIFDYPGRKDLYGFVPKNVDIYKLNFKGYFDFKNTYLLYKILKKIKPDIVVTSMFSASAIFRILKLFLRYKIIVREHNTYTDKTKIHFFVDRILSLITDRVVAVSESVKKYVSEKSHISLPKITVIQNGIDIERVNKFIKNNNRDELRKKFGFGFSDKIILNVARLKPQKNHKLLIDSFVIANKIDPFLKLVILGDGSEKSTLLKYVADHKYPNIYLLGYCENVYDYYYISDIFSLTSDREGFPNVCIEALAFGLPVVSTNVPGVDELIVNGDNGFIVERNEKDVSDKILLIASKIPNISEMQKKCKNTAESFSLEKNIVKYEKLFDSI